jgi:hypothetical protein
MDMCMYLGVRLLRCVGFYIGKINSKADTASGVRVEMLITSVVNRLYLI